MIVWMILAQLTRRHFIDSQTDDEDSSLNAQYALAVEYHGAPPAVESGPEISPILNNG